MGEHIVISALYLFHELLNVRDTLAFKDLKTQMKRDSLDKSIRSYQTPFRLDTVKEDSSNNFLIHLPAMSEVVKLVQSVYCQVRD